MSLDPNKPLRFVGDHDRPVHVAGWLKDPTGGEAVAIFSNDGKGEAWWPKHKLFSKHTGRCLEPGYRTLTIENAPEVVSGFYPLDGRFPTNARGLITLDFAKSEYVNTKYFIEIVSEDEVPKEAKIHAR